MRISKLFFVVLLAGLAALGVSGSDGGLKLSAKVGDTRSYRLAADFTIPDGAVKVAGQVTRKVVKVGSDGTITLQETHSHMSIAIKGNLMNQDDAVIVKLLHPDGTTAELRGEGATPEAYRVVTLSTVYLPDFPLAIDKTWTWDVPPDSKHGVVKAKGDYKVVGDEKLHDIDTWKITFTVTEAEGSTPASNTSTVWISKADGSLVKSESEVKNLPIKGVGPLSGSQSLDMTG
ncbi:MAG: MlaD family protein [Fimbriimonadaceae bacterium]